MKLFLQREATVWHWQVVATLGFSQKRPEITTILALASEASNSIITGQDVSRKLLADRPAVIGERLIRVCHMMRLLEPVESEGQGWRLSEHGRRALMNQEVPAQQRGEFDIWSMEDVLHPEVLLRVKPTELERTTKAGEKRDVGDLMSIPPALANCQGRIFRPPIRTEQESAEIFVFKFEERCRRIGQEAASLSVEISSTGGNARFVVEIEGRKSEFAPVAKISTLSDALNSAGRADIVAPQKITFRTLSDNDRRRSRREIDLEGIHLSGLGTFYHAKLRDVPLVPSTQNDADEWSVWLLLDRIRGYVWPEEFERLVRFVREFAVKENWEFDPVIPTQQELALRCAGQIIVTRKLLVPLDWRALMQPDANDAPPIVILSGRAARGKEAKQFLKKWGDVSQRVYLMESLESNKSGEGLPLSLSDGTRQRAIIRRVRQAPDARLCIQNGQKLGQRWQPAKMSKPELKPTHPKPPKSVEDDGRWRDLNPSEYERLVEELGSTFWKRVVQELQPDGTWVSMKPA